MDTSYYYYVLLLLLPSDFQPHQRPHWHWVRIHYDGLDDGEGRTRVAPALLWPGGAAHSGYHRFRCRTRLHLTVRDGNGTILTSVGWGGTRPGESDMALGDRHHLLSLPQQDLTG